MDPLWFKGVDIRPSYVPPTTVADKSKTISYQTEAYREYYWRIDGQ